MNIFVKYSILTVPFLYSVCMIFGGDMPSCIWPNKECQLLNAIQALRSVYFYCYLVTDWGSFSEFLSNGSVV